MINRITGLDGLRGIAVLAVVLYHADFGFIPGGFLGVDIFFVLSGFLITTILIQEVSTTGRIDRAQFYIRRIRRLIPALILVFIFAIVTSGLITHDAAYPTRRDLPWALGFVLNWSYIFSNESYFVNMSRPPMLQHLWSLSIEEQFYIIWPIILILLAKLRIEPKDLRRVIFWTASIGALLSSAWMAYVSIKNGYPTPNDPSRAYFGTDTHSMGLLIGCATAAIWPKDNFNTKITVDRRNFFNLLGIVSVAVIAYYFLQVSELNLNLYRFGFLVVSLATAVLVILVTRPDFRFGYFLSFQPLVWLGDRSYGIYIWHWPIFMVLRPGIDVTWPDEITTAVRLLLVFIISDLSYRYVEIPIRSGGLRRLRQQWKELGVPKPNRIQIAASVTVLVIFVSSLVGMYRAPIPNAENLLGLGGITAVDEDPTLAPIEPVVPIVIPVDEGVPVPTSDQITSAKNSLVIFGDSVVLSGLIPIKDSFTEVSIDAAVGRQPAEIALRIDLRRKERRLGNDVVIHMGTNGAIARDDLEPILQKLSDRHRVVIVNVKVPRKWMSESNTVINEILPLYPNVRLADWAAEAKNHRGYFGPDGVHLTKTGGKAFAALIKATLEAS